jgi:hypothetical protein
MRRLVAALRASVLGLLAGAAVCAVLGTLKVMLSPGLEVASPSGWLFGPLTILAEGLFWSLLGGAMYVFPPALLAFAFLATRARAGERGPWQGPLVGLGIFALLFLPPFVFGFRGALVDGALLAVAIGFGVRTGLRALDQGLAAG